MFRPDDLDYALLLEPLWALSWAVTLFAHNVDDRTGDYARISRELGEKAPWPARCVPPPGTRGIRDTARPVPQDSALVW